MLLLGGVALPHRQPLDHFRRRDHRPDRDVPRSACSSASGRTRARGRTRRRRSSSSTSTSAPTRPCADVRDAAKQIDRVRIQLQKNPLVKEVTFVSKEEALQGRWQKTNPGLTQAASRTTRCPTPSAVTPKKGEYVDRIATSLKPYPAGVEYLSYGKKTAHKILNVAHLIEVLFLVAVLILLVASTLLIANTIRLSIFSRRREIEVMKLVGASNWFVRGPFMLEGLFTGLIGAILAVDPPLHRQGDGRLARSGSRTQGVHALAFPLNGLILIALGLLLGAAASMLTLRRFLKV